MKLELRNSKDDNGYNYYLVLVKCQGLEYRIQRMERKQLVNQGTGKINLLDDDQRDRKFEGLSGSFL